MCRSVIISLLIIAASLSGAAQNIYELTEPSVEKTIRKGHLALGGKSHDGGSIEVNSYYLSIDGKPAIPVLGEFHYSRYPADQWEEEILKIKAGGVTVIPTYIFWNLHEEVEGVFNWEGDRDIRRFINICKKHDMPVIVRIGPFCHGEIRNGGFPDWLFAKPLEIRSNDPNYLYYVDKFYGEIARQLDGLYYKDGGPIIGCQIENEHQHSAAPWALNYPGAPNDYTSATYDASITMIGVSAQDKEITTADLGDIHMKTLKDIAVSKGIVTPLYTATGHVHEYFLNIDYTGDVAMAFIGGTMILDHFWYGQPWKIGLKRLTEKISKEDLVFYFRPIEQSFSYLIDIPEDDMPDFSDGSVCTINNVEIIPQYVITLEL